MRRGNDELALANCTSFLLVKANLMVGVTKMGARGFFGGKSIDKRGRFLYYNAWLASANCKVTSAKRKTPAEERRTNK